ncbi:MAG: RNA polymerase sigma factor [Nannocystales bacterium]
MARTDAELLAAWRDDDKLSGQKLFERYFAAMTRFFANKVPHDHEDLVQETFAACVRGRDRLREDGRFRSYLFCTAYNVLKKYYTKRARPELAESLDSQAAQDLAPGPSTLLRNTERDRFLLEALRKIPVEQQVVLEMMYWEGMSSSEVGDTLRISAATARTRAHRGREKLATLLARSRPDPLAPAQVDAWAAKVRDRMTLEFARS